MKKVNWGKVDEAKSFEKPCAGAYSIRITNAVDVPDKEYLRIEFDFAEGDFKGYSASLVAAGYKPYSFIRSYKDSARGFFKHFLNSLEHCNPKKFKADGFDGNEQKLIGLYLCVILREEEYLASDGKVKLSTKVFKFLTPEDYRQGNFEVPDMKRLETAADTNGNASGNADWNSLPPPSGQPVINDDDLPF